MPVRLCEVQISLVDASGDSMVGTRVTARLSADIVGAVMVSSATPERAVTDSSGSCSLLLVPNSFGKNATTYTFELLHQGALRPEIHKRLVVPDVGRITLDELLGGEPVGRALIEWDDEGLWLDSMPWDDGQLPASVERWNDALVWDDTSVGDDGETPIKVRLWGDAMVWNDTQVWSA